MSSPATSPRLTGRTVLVTRTRERAAGIVDLLHREGARVIVVPLIATVPTADPEAVAEAADRLRAAPEPRWAVFTSATAVRIVLGAAGAERLRSCRIAAVGPETAAALEREQVRADLVVAGDHTAAALGAALAQRGVVGATVWLPCAEGAAAVLPRTLREAGADVSLMHIYRSAMPHDAPERLDTALAERIDAIALTSGSTARHLVQALRGSPLPAAVAVACIGPQTAREASAAGLPVHVTAATHTAAGLVDALAGLLGVAQPLP